MRVHWRTVLTCPLGSRRVHGRARLLLMLRVLLHLVLLLLLLLRWVWGVLLVRRIGGTRGCNAGIYGQARVRMVVARRVAIGGARHRYRRT